MPIECLAVDTNLLDKVVYHIIFCVITSLQAAYQTSSTPPSSPVARERGGRCVEVLMQLVASGCLDALCDGETLRELLSAMACLPHRLLEGYGGGDGNLWKQLLHLLVGLSKGQGQR